MIIDLGMTFFMVILYLLVTLCRSAVFSSLTRRKRRRGDYPDNGMHKDFISQLPDDILVLIIARTPTTTAVTTSILSKRWRNLYKSVSSFELCCTDLLSYYTLAPHDSDFGLIIYRLERFLRLCSGSKIHCFKLRCCLTKSNENQFKQCIYSLGKSGVEELDLRLSCCTRPSYVSFSCHFLFELPSLKYLTLGTCSLQPNLKSKCYSLQTLDLCHATVVPGSLECILSNCSSLNSLSIFSCRCPPKLCFRGPNLQLKTLIIKNCEGAAEIELYASNLTTFECKNREMVNFVFDYAPQLEIMYFSLEIQTNVSHEWRNMIPYVFGELPKGVPHIKSLAFDTKGDFYQESTRLVSMGMETFGNLRRLDICVCCTPRTNLLALTPYLESCPLLEELHLDVPNMCDDVAVQRKPVVLLHTKLKKAEITGFCGMDNEIEFALYILKTAVALDQMFIIRCVKHYMGTGRWRTFSRTPWREETRKNIEHSLQGQALSKKAKLIIQHQS